MNNKVINKEISNRIKVNDKDFIDLCRKTKHKTYDNESKRIFFKKFLIESRKNNNEEDKNERSKN